MMPQLQWIATDRLRQLKRNPQFQTERQMAALVASIERDGFLVPVLVRPIGDDGYEVVSGNHRVVAAQSAGMAEVPCLVMAIADDDAGRIAINLNTIHGEPRAEQLAPFLAELSDAALSGIHLEREMLAAVETFDRELSERIAALEAPAALDNDPINTTVANCICPACGKRHIRS